MWNDHLWTVGIWHPVVTPLVRCLCLQETSLRVILLLAYQSFGVIYGDLSTSPLYVYRSTFSGNLRMHENDDEILGVLSFIFYTLTFVPVLKYVFIVLSADDSGEGVYPDHFFIHFAEVVCMYMGAMTMCRKNLGLEQNHRLDCKIIPISTVWKHGNFWEGLIRLGVVFVVYLWFPGVSMHMWTNCISQEALSHCTRYCVGMPSLACCPISKQQMRSYRLTSWGNQQRHLEEFGYGSCWKSMRSFARDCL